MPHTLILYDTLMLYDTVKAKACLLMTNVTTCSKLATLKQPTLSFSTFRPFGPFFQSFFRPFSSPIFSELLRSGAGAEAGLRDAGCRADRHEHRQGHRISGSRKTFETFFGL